MTARCMSSGREGPFSGMQLSGLHFACAVASDKSKTWVGLALKSTCRIPPLKKAYEVDDCVSRRNRILLSI